MAGQASLPVRVPRAPPRRRLLTPSARVLKPGCLFLRGASRMCDKQMLPSNLRSFKLRQKLTFLSSPIYLFFPLVAHAFGVQLRNCCLIYAHEDSHLRLLLTLSLSSYV